MSEVKHKTVGTDDELFSIEELRAAACVAECVSGVYILFRGDEPVYVGQSLNVHGRIGNHVRECIKIFDRVTIVEAHPEYLDYMEARYILEFKTVYNTGSLPLSAMALKHGYRRRADYDASTSPEQLQASMERAFAGFE